MDTAIPGVAPRYYRPKISPIVVPQVFNLSYPPRKRCTSRVGGRECFTRAKRAEATRSRCSNTAPRTSLWSYAKDLLHSGMRGYGTGGPTVVECHFLIDVMIMRRFVLFSAHQQYRARIRTFVLIPRIYRVFTAYHAVVRVRVWGRDCSSFSYRGTRVLYYMYCTGGRVNREEFFLCVRHGA